MKRRKKESWKNPETCIYRISLDKKTFILYSILRSLVILTLIRMLLTRNYEGAMLCVLSLILFLLPAAF